MLYWFELHGQLHIIFLLVGRGSSNLYVFNMAKFAVKIIKNASNLATTLMPNQSYEMIPENTIWSATRLNTDAMNSGQESYKWTYRAASSDDIIAFLKIYITPILLFIGTAGNVLSFVVFSRPALKHSVTALFFRVLAVADTLALNICLWPNWMRDAFGVHIYPMTDVSCRIQTYLRYTLPDYAVWVLVVMTIERMVGVMWPHRVHYIFTRRRIRISVLVMAIVLPLINIPVFWVATKNDGDTSVHPCKSDNYELAYQIWPWVDLIIHSLLPFVIMLTCSSIIIKTVYRRRRTLSRQCSVNSTTGTKVKTMTTTLLTVTFVFLFLTAPFVIYATTLNELHGKVDVDYHLFHFSASMLRYANNSVNFFLYCLSGRPFRRELIYLFRGRKRLLARYSSSTTGATYVELRSGTIRSNVIHEPGSPLGSPGFREFKDLPYPE